MTMFTQYGPPDEAGWPAGAREKYADACVAHLAKYAPNVPDAILEREVLAPPDIERIFGLTGGSIFQGEQGMDQMAFMRPSPYLAGYATPVARPLPLRRRDPPGRWRDGRLRSQRREADPQGRAAQPAASSGNCFHHSLKPRARPSSSSSTSQRFE